MEKLGAPQRQSAKEVAIVCDWKDADPFPRFIEAEVDGRSVSLEWRDREDGLRELIVPAHTQSDYPGCSGDPASCPENEGYGCCKPNPPRLAQGEDSHEIDDLIVSLRDRAKWGRGGQFTSPHDSEGTSRLMDLAADVLSRLKPVRADGRDTLEVAQGLAASIWEQHYREDSPNWQPFDNVPGVLSQISNMVSGMTRTTQPPHQDRGDWLDAIDRAIHWMQGAGIIGDTIRLTEVREQIAALTEAKQKGPGEVLARGWFHALPEDDYEFHDDASGAGKDCVGCIRAVIVRETPQVEAKRQTGEDQ